MSHKARERRDKIFAILVTRSQAEPIFRCKHIAKLIGTQISIKTLQEDMRAIRQQSRELVRDAKA